MSAIKVLMVLPTLSVVGGVENYAMNYFRNLDHTSVHMDIVIYTEREISEKFKTEIISVGRKLYILPPVRHLAAHFKMCIKILETEKYDIIHDNSLINTLPLMLVAKKEKVPVRILHSHNCKFGNTRLHEIRNRPFLPILRWSATEYAACSEKAGNAMFGKKSYEIISNVIVADKFQYNSRKRIEVRTEMECDGKFIVGTVAKTTLAKNPFFALDVLKKAIELDKTVEYWWIGNGPLEEQMKDYAKKLKIENKVCFLGQCGNVNDLYQAMDCFFMPSVYEGLPVAGIEAQAMGLPCVFSDNITKELAYTDLAIFIPFSKGIDEWGRILLNIKNNKRIDREVYHDKLKSSDFSDTGCGQRLLEYYKNRIQKVSC